MPPSDFPQAPFVPTLAFVVLVLALVVTYALAIGRAFRRNGRRVAPDVSLLTLGGIGLRHARDDRRRRVGRVGAVGR